MKSSKPSVSLARKPVKAAQLKTIYQWLKKVLGHQKWWPAETPFEMMVGAILTQNTAWANVEKAIRNLKDAKVLTVPAMAKISKRRLARLIRPAGYFNIKADRLKHFVRFLIKEFRGDLNAMFLRDGKSLRNQLLGVKGIGPETADSILLYGARKSFFVIDAYTKRIFSRHGLYDADRDYEAWRALFERSLPRKRDLYNDFHAQIVAVGKEFCRSKPRCEACPLKSYL
ncbi:MAG: endonuclease III domain-containing protein [Candidatus Omnitrophica bacterium]|nr:endonuclease III domain-containing protein [Candidatus Omnitrophota bacterium]